MILQLDDSIKRVLIFIPDDIKQKCEEIRLRAKLPVCLTVNGEIFFVGSDSTVCDLLPKNPLIASADAVNTTLSLLCNKSVYLHENEIKQGFISLPNGGRAGVCGIYNAEGMLVSVSSVNIRIARQIFNVATPLLPYATGGLLIAGPPGSGKTTMLRDLVRLLSHGAGNKYYRVAVIDSRGEISGGGRYDLGVNTDVINTYNKSFGTEIALRTMFPHFIAFDEIGSLTEFESIKNCLNAGVHIITTAHSGDETDIFNRDITQKIIKSNAVKAVAFLSSKNFEAPRVLLCKEIIKNVYD